MKVHTLPNGWEIEIYYVSNEDHPGFYIIANTHLPVDKKYRKKKLQDWLHENGVYWVELWEYNGWEAGSKVKMSVLDIKGQFAMGFMRDAELTTLEPEL